MVLSHSMNDFSSLFSTAEPEVANTVLQFRKTIKDILSGHDKRTLLIVGPCSIDNLDAALVYAEKLKRLSDEVADTFFIVMRSYLEKSRTALGWRGFLSDPDLNGSSDYRKGIPLARAFLTTLAQMGLPAATEFLDPIIAPCYSDLISWGSIGARTVQSPIHRQLASALPMAVGLKNRTDGNVDVAIEAIEVAAAPHVYFGTNSNGVLDLKKSSGNCDGHIVLRGSDTSANYDSKTLQEVAEKLAAKKLLNACIIDCSHGNAQKNYKNQIAVFENSMKLIQEGTSIIKGLMLESYLEAGRSDLSHYCPGLSLTDPCLSFEETAELITAHANQEVYL